MTKSSAPSASNDNMKDDWIEPADDRVDFLAADPEVDSTNPWVRRGARDEMDGRRRTENPYERGRRSNLHADWRGWLEGWMASGGHHGRFDRDAHLKWKAEMDDYMTKQAVRHFEMMWDGVEKPPLPMPKMPD